MRSYVTLRVFDVLGREVALLAHGFEEPGYRSVRFNANNVVSGVYFCRLHARLTTGGQGGDFTQIRKLLLLK